MKSLCWSVLFVPFLFSCATHSPLSEVIMFNTAQEGEIPESFALAATFDRSGITEDDHQEINKGDYDRIYSIKEPISINVLAMNEDDWGLNASFGHSLGVDATKKLDNNTYGSLAVSGNRSAKLVIYQRIFNNRTGGAAVGPFFGVDGRRYYSAYNCYDDPCQDLRLTPDAVSVLLNTGVKTRFLFRTSDRPSLIFTGSVEYGWIFDVEESFIGLSFSLSSF